MSYRVPQDAFWLSSLPPHWAVIKGRYLGRISKVVLGPGHSGRYGRLSLTMNGVLPRAREATDGLQPKDLDSYQLLRKGDLVFKLIDLSNVSTSRVGLSPAEGLVSPAYIVMTPNSRLDARFAYYYYFDLYSQRVFNTIAGDGVRSALGPNDLRDLVVPSPPLSEQRAIADYLDRETAQIDAFIAKNEELIALLAERRDSLWRELYDDAATSGELVPIRRLVVSIVDGPFGSSLTSAHYSTSGTRVIRLGNIGINDFKHADEAFISTEYAAQLATHAARAGDVIVAGLGDERMPLGRACVLPDIGPAIVKADCYRVRPNRLAAAEYLAWVLSAPPTRGQMRLLARGTTRLRLNTSVVRDVQVPVPSASLQAELVARFGRRAAEIDAASRKAERAIDLARERRAALISAAVTGKIDVGEAA